MKGGAIRCPVHREPPPWIGSKLCNTLAIRNFFINSVVKLQDHDKRLQKSLTPGYCCSYESVHFLLLPLNGTPNRLTESARCW